MLNERTADCLALPNTAILVRLVEELIERGVIARHTALFRNAVSDLENCPRIRGCHQNDPKGTDAETCGGGFVS
jgi:hypothetical protein